MRAVTMLQNLAAAANQHVKNAMMRTSAKTGAAVAQRINPSYTPQAVRAGTQADYKSGYAAGMAFASGVNRVMRGAPIDAYVHRMNVTWQQGFLDGVHSSGGKVVGTFVMPAITVR